MNALWAHGIGVMILLLMSVFIGIWVWAWLPRHEQVFAALAQMPRHDSLTDAMIDAD